MAKVITSTGEYLSKKSGEKVGYEFEYATFSNLEDAISTLGEDVVLKNVQRMVKIDASNTAREAAKVANGDSVRAPLTEAEKAQRKQERQANSALLAKIKALTAEQREALGL